MMKARTQRPPGRRLATRLLRGTLALLLAVALLLGLAIGFGGPGHPRPMASISEPFRHLDPTGLPEFRRFRGPDGLPLAYRCYDGAAPLQGSVVLVHGSSASGASLQGLARALGRAGWQACTLDMRGHGASGERGRLDRIGQLEDDVAAFLEAVPLPRPVGLAGFSSGGGFVLRFAAGPLRARFDHYLLLAPFISQDAPTQRPDSGGWVSVGLPRLIALGVLDGFGIDLPGHLPVMRFALDPEAARRLTPTYDYRLASNFRPRADWQAELRAVDRPIALVAGAEDEAFDAARYEPMLRDAGLDWPVRLVPGLGHVALTLEPAAFAVIVDELRVLSAARSSAAPGR